MRTKLCDVEKLSAIYIGESACFDDEIDEKSLLRLLDCITCPADPADPDYDFQKDRTRKDLLRNNDFSSLRDECLRRGLNPPPHKSEMLSLLLTHKLDPTLEVSDHRRSTNPPVVLLSSEEMANTNFEISSPLPESEEFRLLRNRPRIPGMPNAKPVVVDGLERHEVRIAPQRFLRSIEQAGDDDALLASQGGLRGYVVHSRRLGASTPDSSINLFSSVLLLLTDVDFRTLEVRLLADELASLTSQTVLLLDWQRAVIENPMTSSTTSDEALRNNVRHSPQRRYGTTTRRRMTDDLLATLRYASAQLRRELFADTFGDGGDVFANVQMLAMGEAAGVALEVAALQQHIAQALARDEMRQHLRVINGEDGVAMEIDGTVAREILASFAVVPLARTIDDFQDEDQVVDGLRIVSPGESQPERLVNWEEMWHIREHGAAMDESASVLNATLISVASEAVEFTNGSFPNIADMESAVRELDSTEADSFEIGADRWRDARQSLVSAFVSSSDRDSTSDVAELAKLLRSSPSEQVSSREESRGLEVDPFSRRERGLSLVARVRRLLDEPGIALQEAIRLRADRATLSHHDVASRHMQCASISALWPSHYDAKMVASTLRQPVFCVFGEAQKHCDGAVWASAVSRDYRSFADAALFSIDGSLEEFVRSASPTVLLSDHLPVFALRTSPAPHVTNPDEVSELVQLAGLRCLSDVLSERDPKLWLAARRRGTLAALLQVWLDVYGQSPSTRTSVAGCFKAAAMLRTHQSRIIQSRTPSRQWHVSRRFSGVIPSGELEDVSASLQLIQEIEPDDISDSANTFMQRSWAQFLHIMRASLNERQRARWRVLEETKSISPTTAALHWSAAALRRLQTCFETEFADEMAKQAISRVACGESTSDDLRRLSQWFHKARNCFDSDSLEPPLWK